MNKKRLLKLADLLQADAKNKKGAKFDLRTWAKPSDPGHRFGSEVELSCGTTACAVGIACLSGAFKRSGLGHRVILGGTYVIPTFKGKDDYEAVCEFFGITDKQAHFLFDEQSYQYEHRTGAAGERMVAKRIRNFADGKVAA